MGESTQRTADRNDRLVKKPRKPSGHDVQNKAKVEDFGERGMGVAGKE